MSDRDIEAIRQRCKEVGHVLGSCSLEGDFKPGLLGEMHGHVQALLVALDAVTGERDELKAEYATLSRVVSNLGIREMEWLEEREKLLAERDAARVRYENALTERDHWERSYEAVKAERHAALHSRDEYLKLWQQVTAGLMDVQEENKRLRAALERYYALVSAGVMGRLFGHEPITSSVEQEINEATDQARAALAARGGGDE